MEYIITFMSTNLAIKAEHCLTDENFNVKAAPLPAQIGAGCGICLRIDPADAPQAMVCLAENDIGGVKLYSRELAGGTYVYRENPWMFPECNASDVGNASDVSNAKTGHESLVKPNGDIRVLQESIAKTNPGSPAKINLESCTSGGCGAKISPGELSKLLTGLPVYADENLLVGFESSDDAAVYKLDGEHSIVTTADFFPPMVEDPRTFGRIAAANALSDVYAMGAKPLTALNLVCFPQSMDLSVLKEILMGGAEKVAEASAVLCGGHSIYDREPKYGLAVTGLVSNDKVIRNDRPEPGHKLILTKPLGTGLILSAFRGGVAGDDVLSKAVRSMERLNKYAAEKASAYSVSACTDVTGFGLLAHALEMASDKVSIVLYSDEIPFFEEAYVYADEFLMTAAGQRNRNHTEGKATVEKLPFAMQELLFDPQTSGGLLLCVAPDQANDLLAAIREGDPRASIVGEIILREKEAVLL